MQVKSHGGCGRRLIASVIKMICMMHLLPTVVLVVTLLHDAHTVSTVPPDEYVSAQPLLVRDEHAVQFKADPKKKENLALAIYKNNVH